MSRPIATVIVAVTALTACATSASTESFYASGASSSSESVHPEMAAWAGMTFPRTATTILDQDRLPSVAELSRYDLVIIDAEWQNRVPRTFFAQLRAANPRLKVLAYINPVDKMPRTGSRGYWANAYSLWQFSDSTTSTFPKQWLSYTAAGRPVHEWPGHVMTNLTDVAPRVGGQNYAEYVSNWIVDHIWSTGLWDGIYLDVWADRLYTVDADAWDIDGDGHNESAAQIMGPGGPLDRGLSEGEQILRTRMPTAILIANGDRTLHPDALNGRAFESFADPLAGSGTVPSTALEKYVSTAQTPGLSQPSTVLTIDRVRGSATSRWARARFFLTATLMQNGWWAPMGVDYAATAYYDELDGGGRGRGYLGAPVLANPSLDQLGVAATDSGNRPVSGVYRRDFSNGIALVNTSGRRVTVRLERAYRHLLGTQDPVVNNGKSTSTITLDADDGVILVR